VAVEPPAGGHLRATIVGLTNSWRPAENLSALDRLLAAGTPSAGAATLDAALIEQGVEAFFARLSAGDSASAGGGLSAGVASWLASVAAAALEIARHRDKSWRSASAADGAPELPT
jgi:hypothetical protein